MNKVSQSASHYMKALIVCMIPLIGLSNCQQNTVGDHNAIQHPSNSADDVKKPDDTRATSDIHHAKATGNPPEVDRLIESSQDLIKKGQYTEAVLAADEAYEISPHNALVLNARGNAYLAWGRVGRAIEDFETAVRINPHYPDIWSNLGAAQFRSESLDLALDYLDEALRLDPDHHDALLNKCLALMRLNRYEEALPVINHFIELYPDFAHAYHYRGSINKELGQLNAALEDYNQAISLHGNVDTYHAQRNEIRRLIDQSK